MEPGTVAPPFTLPDQDGRPVTLSELAGRWVVLFFYPKDDTPGCTIEAREFTAAKAALNGLDAIVYGCSADSAEKHRKFIAKCGLGVGLLTDADRAVMKTYGAWGKKVMYGKPVEGVIRSTVLIAPDGRIAHHWQKVKAQGHAEQVRRTLAELQGLDAPAAATEPDVLITSVPPAGASIAASRGMKPKTKAAKAKAKAKPAARTAPKQSAGKPAAKGRAKAGRAKGRSAAKARGGARSKKR